MTHKIPIKLFEIENKFFTIKNADTDKNFVNIIYLDMQQSTQTESQYPTILSPTIFQKTFKFSPINILITRNFMSNYKDEIILLYNNIKNIILTDFFKKALILGEQHSLINIKFDIDVSEIKKDSKHIGQTIINRLANASHYIAAEGRIGPAQWFVSNNKTYNYILSYMTDLGLDYNSDGQLLIGNAPFIIDELIDDDVILLGRKNVIEQAGIHCIMRTDSDSNIIFQEYSGIGGDVNFTMQYAMDYVGSKPCLQYFKINTRSIGYYRKQKLKRIKELYE